MRLTTGLCIGLAAVVAGCGGGGPSREDYIAEADKICREAEQTFASLEDELSGIGENATSEEEVLEEARTIFARAAEEAKPFADQLSDLEAPDDIADEAERYASTVQEGVAAIERAAEVKTVQELQEVGQSIAESDAEQERLGEEIGFKDCTESSSEEESN